MKLVVSGPMSGTSMGALGRAIVKAKALIRLTPATFEPHQMSFDQL